ncbi:hypothetical protein C8J56DRAFT_773478 [Mycena floridula]|nr:hypothetical protein C8J56DRAFT_773478 [Mycena floridula]
MIPTPDLSHLSSTDFEHVYEPAEDTFIFLDALETDADLLRASGPSICLEIGQLYRSGSGCVSSFLSTVLGASSSLYLCTDINSLACRATSRTGIQNHASALPNSIFQPLSITKQGQLDAINASLALPLLRRLQNSVDIILFNPPYVPTTANEALEAQDSRHIHGSWAGGSDGMQVTDIFLEMVPKLLSPQGRFYLVAIKQNNIPDIQQRMLEIHKLESQIVLQRRAGREHLFILRFSRQAS